MRTIIVDSLPETVAPSKKDLPAMPFLQMATAESVQVGCSMKLCKNSSSHNFYSIACYYGPPPVKLYVPIYNPGQPCSQCRPGTECIEKLKICALKSFADRVNSQGK
ncbi:hypothetical protein DICVIV_14337 [Dictyocaulus viviparus]|uniref:SCP domain-containing protein n=1 Tax=Dictyocaulus viviparus TaxID=29172 RepID=A0A0D8X5H2_DICVI|nr:hypothetical protein DICVIV_14337 [Dictyocaulus viviparus]